MFGGEERMGVACARVEEMGGVALGRRADLYIT